MLANIAVDVIKDICEHNMEQMVRKPTRGQKVLDIFLANCLHLWMILEFLVG